MRYSDKKLDGYTIDFAVQPKKLMLYCSHSVPSYTEKCANN